MPRETCVEITVKVPLSQSITLPLALAAAQVTAMRVVAADDDVQLAAVAILADGRRLQIGEDKIREWVGT